MTAELESAVQRMCNLSTAIENKAREEGIKKVIEEGINIGELRATVKQYKKGRITLAEAAEDLKMTEEEFTEKINQLPSEL